MKTFCKLTAQSPAASYVPLPRFLLQDEALRDISNDAKVLYALPDRVGISRQIGYLEPDGTLFRLTSGQFRSVHRHMEAVGYDLYVKMPGQAISAARGEAPQP